MSLVQARRQMKYLMVLVWMFIAIFVLGAAFMYGGSGRSSRGGAGTSEGLFAKINGHEVSMQDYKRSLDSMRQQFTMMGGAGRSVSLEQQQDLPRYAYDQILREYTQAEAAEANGVQVSEGDAGAEIEKRVQQRLDQLKVGSTPEQIEQMKGALLNVFSTDDVRRELLSQRFTDKMTQEARPVEIKVAHILIKPEGRTEAQALKLAKDIARRARAGEDFAKLATQFSDDQGTKVNGGVLGWVSAQPPNPDPKSKTGPNPEDAGHWVPEFTAASLRLSKSRPISEPTRSTFGYHVIKYIQERDFQPKLDTSSKDPKAIAAAVDPKKKAEAIDAYKKAAGQAIADGTFSDYKTRAEVQAYSPWLKGYLAEEEAKKAPAPMPNPKDKTAKPPTDADRYGPAIAQYQAAMTANGPEVDAGLAYKLGKLYAKVDQPQKAIELYKSWEKRGGGPEMYVAEGEAQEKLKDKTAALAAYQEAMTETYNNPEVMRTLVEKFKGLQRTDLADKAAAKQAEQQKVVDAQRAEEEKQRNAMFSTQMKTAMKGLKTGKKSKAPASQTIQVKTGDVDPKTGKPKILSVKPVPGSASDDKKAPTAAEKKPAGP